MKAAKIRFRFADGSVEYVDEAQAATIRASQLSRYAVALAEAAQAQAEVKEMTAQMQAEAERFAGTTQQILTRLERARLARELKNANKKKHQNSNKLHAAIIVDYERFRVAFRSYERTGLDPLLVR